MATYNVWSLAVAVHVCRSLRRFTLNCPRSIDLVENTAAGSSGESLLYRILLDNLNDAVSVGHGAKIFWLHSY